MAVMDIISPSAPTPLKHTEDPEIQRIRKIFLIILGILLIFCLISTIYSIADLENVNTATNNRKGSQIGSSLLGILIYVFGIIVAYRYSPRGLRIFGCFGVIELIFMGSLIAIFLVFIMISLVNVNHANNQIKGVIFGTSVGSSIAAIMCIISFILLIIIVKFAFKLARLIDENKILFIQQIQ